MNNFELDQAARDMAAGKTQYQLARELLLAREKNKVRRVDSADLDRFREAANRAAPPASTVMFEMIALIEAQEVALNPKTALEIEYLRPKAGEVVRIPHTAEYIFGWKDPRKMTEAELIADYLMRGYLMRRSPDTFEEAIDALHEGEKS